MMPPRAPLPSINAADFSARVAIVVPYRDRAEHLARLVPRLVTFFAWERHRGTFTSLPHPRDDFLPDGNPGPEARLTAGIYARKLTEGDAGFGREGLSTLNFSVTATAQWQRNGVTQPHVLHHHVVLE
jgi:hypothetical protein